MFRMISDIVDFCWLNNTHREKQSCWFLSCGSFVSNLCFQRNMQCITDFFPFYCNILNYFCMLLLEFCIGLKEFHTVEFMGFCLNQRTKNYPKFITSLYAFCTCVGFIKEITLCRGKNGEVTTIVDGIVQ